MKFAGRKTLPLNEDAAKTSAKIGWCYIGQRDTFLP